MKDLLKNKYKFVIFLTVIAICLACFGTIRMINAQAEGKYMTKVEGTYSSSVNLLKLKVTVDLSSVGDVKTTVAGKTYPFSWSGNAYERSIAGVKIGTTVQINAYNFDGKIIETKNYTIDKNGKFVETVPTKTVPCVCRKHQSCPEGRQHCFI